MDGMDVRKRTNLCVLLYCIMNLLLVINMIPPVGILYSSGNTEVDNQNKYEIGTWINDYVYLEEGVDISCKERIMVALMPIPSQILSDFLDNGWHISITPQKLTTEDVDECLGLLSTSTKTITVYDGAINGRTLTHEMGHYYDLVMHQEEGGGLSNSTEWANAYREEKDALSHIDHQTKHNSYNEREAFAEVFSLYIKNDESGEQIPEMWELMKNFLAENE